MSFKKYIFLSVLLLLQVVANAQSEYYIDSLIIEVSKAKPDTNKLALLSIIAENGDDAIWPMYNNEMGKLAARLQRSDIPEIKLSAKKYLAASLNNKGFFFAARGISYKAIMYFNMSLLIQREIEDKLGESYSLNNLGSMYDSKGDVSKALEFYFESIRIREQIKNKKGIAESLNNIAIIYNHQNDLRNALKYHTQSLKLRKEINDPRGLGLAYNNIGTIYIHIAENKFKAQGILTDSLIDRSLYYFREGYKAYEHSGNNEDDGKALSLFNIAAYYSLKADGFKNTDKRISDSLLNLATNYYLQSLEIFTSLNSKEWMSNSMNGLSNVYFRRGDKERSMVFGNKAMALAKELGYPETIQNSAEILRKIYQRDGDYKTALVMTDLYFSMRDSITNENNKKESVAKHFMYESEKKEVLAKANQEKAELAFEARSRQHMMVIYFIIICLVLLSVFGVFMYKRYKLSQKQNRIIYEQKRIVEHQKHIVEESRKEIVDSINYAKRIQYALLAHDDLLSENLPSHFVLFKPKDIVSGDFYWATKQKNKFYLALGDSTGHGVPGAFMSLLNIGFLSEAINEKAISEPHEVFNYVRRRLIDSISKENQQDGMDGVLLCFDELSNELTYCSAHVSPVLIRNGNIKELYKDKMPVGKGENMNSFTSQKISIQKGDALYLYTDGYADQFGGDKGKKFKYKPLNELLLHVSSLPMEEQATTLEEKFTQWRGVLDQVDDVCIIGIKF